MGEDYDYLFKCIVVGDGGVGKTALTLRFSKGFFTEDYKMTIGVDFHVKTIKVDTQEGDTLAAKLQIWDTGGQERFSSIRPMYYRGSLGALLIFDLTSMASFEHLPQWIEEVRANVQNNIPLLLVGNKSDLEDQRQVSLAEINDFTKKFDLYYMETSAKTGEGVGDCFSVLAYLMIGQGVPDTLLSEDTVFSPGNVLVGAPQTVQPKASINVDQPVAETSTNFEPEAEYEYDAPPIPEPITNQPTVQSASESQPLSEKNFQPKSHKAVIFDENEAIRAEEKYEYDAPPVPEVKGNFRPETESQLDPEIPLPKMEQPKTSKSVEEFEFKMPDEIIDQEEGSSIPTFSSSKASIKTLESSSFSPKSVPFTASTPEPAPAPKEFIPSIESSEKDLDSEISPLLFTSSQPGNKPTKSSDSLVDYLPKPMFEEEDKKKKKKKKEKKKKDKKKEKKKELEEEKKEQQNLFDEMRSVGKKEKESKSKVFV
ncbi:MAG: GTP-binding protein [Candidatus Lokiarchaeota archaeon]